MLSGVLKSDRAVQVNIAIMRAFVRMRETMASHRELAQRLNVLEKTYDARFRVVFDAIRALMQPQKTPRRRTDSDLFAKGTGSKFGRGMQ
jgi:DnaJ-domain-containing protein 1